MVPVNRSLTDRTSRGELGCGVDLFAINFIETWRRAQAASRFAPEVDDRENIGMTKTVSPRRFSRVRPSGLVSTGAKIMAGSRDPAIDCKLIDISAGGACLDVDLRVTLPPRFELLHANTRKRCRVVWRAGRRVGVSF